MNTVSPALISLILTGVLYLPIAGVILKRRGFQEWATRLLVLYVGASSLWTLGLVFLRPGGLATPAQDVPARVWLYGLLLLAWLFLHLTRAFLRFAGSGWGWWALGAAWIVAAIVLNENWLGLPEVSWAGGHVPPTGVEGLPATPTSVGGLLAWHWSLAFGVAIAGWGAFMGGATLLTARAYHQAQQPLHRNRIKYWAVALGLTASGAVLTPLLAGTAALGSGFHLLGTLCATYAVLTYRQPDVRQVARRTASFLIVTLLTVVIYTAGFLATQALFQSVPGYSPLLAGVTVALVLAVVFAPLLRLAQRLADQVVSGTHYDPGRTLHEYSTHISNILDLERLATVALDLIRETMQIQHGTLFVVHEEPGQHVPEDLPKQFLSPPLESKYSYFRLRDVTGTGKDSPPGALSAASPVADYLRQERRPLTQYDVDLLPRFRENSPAEQGWLASLGADVYVPIYAKGEWIGLLALGPKTCGDRYFDEDLALLSTLADQTAVALENARLFDDLKVRNTENEQLNQELAVANRELARLDEAKSNFIDIASHELRTPLTQICGYNEILGEMVEEGSLTPDTALQMAQGIHKGAQRLQEIVDLMFDVSQLDTETLILNLSHTQVSLTVHQAVESWARALEERRQTLVVEGLESLPALTADGKRLVQVFSHLVQNAIKYTPDGGHIRITGRLLNGVTEPQERAVEIVVADTGIGIAPDDLGRIFDKFYRAGDVMFHSTGKTKFKGAGPGLGLTIARGIVEAHGGRIWAESLGYDEQTRPGSQFHVVLPVQPHRLESAGLETFIAAVRANTEQINVTV